MFLMQQKIILKHINSMSKSQKKAIPEVYAEKMLIKKRACLVVRL